MNSKAQIIATLGPSSANAEILFQMISHQTDVVRLNFSWGDLAQKKEWIEIVREAAKKSGRKIPIIADLPGPRVQTAGEHTYDDTSVSAFTAADREFVKFCAEEKLEYIAVSFVGSAADVNACRQAVAEFGSSQKIIAKIERKAAVENLDEIIAAADAVMVARGDLGNEIPLEQIPFVQVEIMQKCKQVGKPVIVATQMLLSMTENPLPTRAEVTDVAYAILEGADAIMLSEETARGKYPAESVMMMEKIVLEAEKHMQARAGVNLLV